MTESDIERLRQFGQQVQTKKEIKESKKTTSLSNIDARKIKDTVVVFKRKSILVCGSIKSYCIKKIIFVKSLIHQRHKRKQYQLHKVKHQVTSSTVDPTCIVEHQRQWGNTSIIIRRRKKISLIPDHKDSIPFPPSSAIAYYFHRIETKEHEQKNLFSPRSSIWDLPYQSRELIPKKIKSLFHYRK